MKSMNWRSEAERRIDILRDLGFFADLELDEYEELVHHVAALLEEVDGDLSPEQILACDDESMLSFEVERIHERGDYAQLLIELAALSEGDFLPVFIEERLEPDRLRAEVSFVWLGHRHHLPLTYLGTWADIGGLLTGLNQVLERGDIDYRYYLLGSGDDLAHVVYMQPALHDRAVVEGILQFEELDEAQAKPYISERLLTEYRAN